MAYELVERRYGPNLGQIVALAPLLFTLLAEGSLAWCRQKLEEVKQAVEHLLSIWREKPHLYFARYVAQEEEGMFIEERSIAQADLLGDSIRQDTENSLFDPDDAHDVKPFSDYLCELADNVGLPGIVEFSRHIDTIYALFMPVPEIDFCWGAEPYQVCRQDLAEITGGSKYALWALVTGSVRLSEITAELMPEEATPQRIEWLESRLPQETRKSLEVCERYAEELRVQIDTVLQETEAEGRGEEGER